AASLFLPGKATAGACGAALAIVAALPALSPAFSAGATAGPFLFTLAVCLYVVGSKRQRLRLEAERESAIAHLRDSQEQFRMLVENANAGIFMTNDAYQLTYVNQRFADLSGYGVDELIGMDTRQLVHPESREMVSDIARRRLQGEAAPNQYEFNWLRKDGE